MRYSKITLFFSLLLFFAACVKKKNYPITPVIEFKSISFDDVNRKANIIIGFKDGDGDLGLAENNPTLGVYLKYYYKDVNGVYQTMDTSLLSPTYDTLIDTYLIKLDITPLGKNKAVEGDFIIKRDYDALYYRHAFIPDPQFVKYEFYIQDRAKHVSNRVQTTEIDLSTIP